MPARTLIPPAFKDAWSFSGRGRWSYQALAPDPRDPSQITPTEPVHEGASLKPGEPRG